MSTETAVIAPENPFQKSLQLVSHEAWADAQASHNVHYQAATAFDLALATGYEPAQQYLDDLWAGEVPESSEYFFHDHVRISYLGLLLRQTEQRGEPLVDYDLHKAYSVARGISTPVFRAQASLDVAKHSEGYVRQSIVETAIAEVRDLEGSPAATNFFAQEIKARVLLEAGTMLEQPELYSEALGGYRSHVDNDEHQAIAATIRDQLEIIQDEDLRQDLLSVASAFYEGLRHKNSDSILMLLPLLRDEEAEQLWATMREGNHRHFTTFAYGKFLEAAADNNWYSPGRLQAERIRALLRRRSYYNSPYDSYRTRFADQEIFDNPGRALKVTDDFLLGALSRGVDKLQPWQSAALVNQIGRGIDGGWLSDGTAGVLLHGARQKLTGPEHEGARFNCDLLLTGLGYASALRRAERFVLLTRPWRANSMVISSDVRSLLLHASDIRFPQFLAKANDGSQR